MVVLEAGKTKTLIETSIYPRKIVENDVDIFSPSTGNLVVQARSQLAMIDVVHGSFLPRRNAFCTYRDVTKASQRPLPIRVTSNKLICVADTDSDGRLDALSNCWAHYPDLLMDLFCNKQIEVIDVPYRNPEPASYETRMRLKLVYLGNDNLQLEVGSSDGTRIFRSKQLHFKKLRQGARINIFDHYVKLEDVAPRSYRIIFDEALGPKELTLFPEWTFID